MTRHVVTTMPCKVIEVERFADGTPMRCLVAPFGQEWAAIWVWADHLHKAPAEQAEMVRQEIPL